MRAVNLLPKNQIRSRRRSSKSTPWALVIGFAGIAVASAAVGAVFLQANGKAADGQAELADVSAQLAALPKPKAVQNPDAALTVARDERATAVASAFSYHVSWDRVLRRLALVLPDDVWLTSLSAQAPMVPGVGARTLTADAASTGMTLMGYTYSHAGVARLLSRLTVLPDLSRVQLQTSTLADIGKRKVVQFTILANVKPGGPAT
jgi:Tfp pilus assembly protein PilN